MVGRGGYGAELEKQIAGKLLVVRKIFFCVIGQLFYHGLTLLKLLIYIKNTIDGGIKQAQIDAPALLW